LTPSEVRSIALSELNLKPTSIVWDIGAGSGSVAIEAAQIARSGRVYAIEMDAEDYGMLMDNARLFSVPNVVGVLGEAPGAWANLPDPDAIFIGGTGRSVSDLAAASWQRLQRGGCLIANVMSMEYASALQQLMIGTFRVEPRLWMIQISRGIYQLEKHRLETANPNFLIKAVKE
jgi:precorrin-6Y C5,15-methyltransferase (decarboxylating)